jgi:hypothetical protein
MFSRKVKENPRKPRCSEENPRVLLKSQSVHGLSKGHLGILENRGVVR